MTPGFFETSDITEINSDISKFKALCLTLPLLHSLIHSAFCLGCPNGACSCRLNWKRWKKIQVLSKIEVSCCDQNKTSIQYWGNVSKCFKIMVTSVSDWILCSASLVEWWATLLIYHICHNVGDKTTAVLCGSGRMGEGKCRIAVGWCSCTL